MALMDRGGIYWFRKKINGKDYWKSTGYRVGSKANRDAAKRRALDFEKEIRDTGHGYTRRAVPTYGEAVATYLDGKLTEVKNKAATIDDLNRTLSGWRTKKLDQFTAEDCQSFVKGMQNHGYKQNTIRQTIIRSKAVFSWALRAGLISTNPWDSVKLPKAVSKTRTLSMDEQRKVLEFLLAPFERPPVAPGKGKGQQRFGKGRWPSTPEGQQSARKNAECVARIFLLMLATGLRIFEVKELAPQHIQFNTGTMRIVGKGGRLRGIPLRPEVAQLLRDQMASRQQDLGRSLKSDELLFVFRSSRHSARMTSSFYFQLVNRQFHEAADACEIPRFSAHDCRRTFGTRCAEGGVPMPTLQRWMGHASISTTAEYYVHLGGEADKAILRDEVDLGISLDGFSS